MDDAPADLIEAPEERSPSAGVAAQPAETPGPVAFPAPSSPGVFPAPAAAPAAAPARSGNASGNGPDPVSHATHRRRVRWMDTAVTLVLASSVGGFLFVAMPPLLRATGLGAPPAAVVPARTLRTRHAPPPLFHEDTNDEEDPVEDLMRPPTLPGLRGHGDPLDRPPGGDPPGLGRDAPGLGADTARPGSSADDRSDGKQVKMGLARHGLKLRERPAEGTEVTGAVRAGEVVMIMKDLGEWVLIMHSGDDDVSMGWTKRSEIAVR